MVLKFIYLGECSVESSGLEDFLAIGADLKVAGFMEEKNHETNQPKVNQRKHENLSGNPGPDMTSEVQSQCEVKRQLVLDSRQTTSSQLKDTLAKAVEDNIDHIGSKEVVPNEVQCPDYTKEEALSNAVKRQVILREDILELDTPKEPSSCPPHSNVKLKCNICEKTFNSYKTQAEQA